MLEMSGQRGDKRSLGLDARASSAASNQTCRSPRREQPLTAPTRRYRNPLRRCPRPEPAADFCDSGFGPVERSPVRTDGVSVKHEILWMLGSRPIVASAAEYEERAIAWCNLKNDFRDASLI